MEGTEGKKSGMHKFFHVLAWIAGIGITILAGWLVFVRWFRYSNAAIMVAITKYTSLYTTNANNVSQLLTDRVNEMLEENDQLIQNFAMQNKLTPEVAVVQMAYNDLLADQMLPVLGS